MQTKIIESYKKYITYNPEGNGLWLDDKMPFDSYSEAVKDEGKAVVHGLFRLGDLFNEGERIFGEKWAQALNNNHYKEKTVSNASWVCSQFPPSRRHPALTFNHHAAVAGIPDIAEREKLLKEAEENDLTVTELTEIKKERFPKPKKKKKDMPARDASESHEDAPQEGETQEAVETTETTQISEEEAIQAQKVLIAFIERVKKEEAAALSLVFSENMTAIRRVARRIGFYGGTASGKKKK